MACWTRCDCESEFVGKLLKSELELGAPAHITAQPRGAFCAQPAQISLELELVFDQIHVEAQGCLVLLLDHTGVGELRDKRFLGYGVCFRIDEVAGSLSSLV